MSRLADATICPDCRAPLAAATCTACGLGLAGPLGQRLWETMVSADRLVEQLRAAPATTAAAAGPPSTSAKPPRPATPTPALGVAPVPPGARPRRGLPALSVPAVLLSLGALCLVVAAVVFVAIAWGALGLAGRTLVLLGVTGVLAAVAVHLTRRGLRGAAETFWFITAAMLGLDLLAARSAGLAGLDRLSWSGAGVLVGGALFVLATVVATWSRRTPSARLVGLEAVAAAGATLATDTGSRLPGEPAVGVALAVAVLGALAVVVLPRLARVGQALLVLAGLSWLGLVLVGVVRALDDEVSRGVWQSQVHAWPLALAGAYAALASLARRSPLAARVTLSGLSLACLATLASTPLSTSGDTRATLAHATVLVALAAVAAHAPRAWSLGAAVVGASGGLVVALQLAAAPWVALDGSHGVSQPAPWAWLASGLAVAALGAAGPRVVRAPSAAAARAVALQVVTAAALLGAAAAVTTTTWVPRWGHVGACLAAGVAVASLAWVRRSSHPGATVGGLSAGYLALLALALAAPSERLTAASATVVALVLVAAFVRGQHGDGETSPALTAGLAVLAGAWAVPAWVSVLSLGHLVHALVLGGYAGGVALLAGPVSRRTVTRWSWEVSALVPAVAALLVSPGTAATALVLTETGTLLAVLAVRHTDRVPAGWAVVAAMTAATVLRLDLVTVVESVLWVLPAAVLLVAGGLRRGGAGLPTLVGSGTGTAYVALVALATDGVPGRWSTVLAAALAVAAGALAAHLGRRGVAGVAAAAGVLAAWSGAVASVGVVELLHGDATTRALALAVYAAVVVLVAAPVSRTALCRVALETAAAVVAVVALGLCPDRSTLAMVLTVVGTAVALLAVLHRDRELLGWAGVVVLGAATVVRVLAEVQAPELYTLPAALLLLAAGLRRLRLDPASDSLRCLGSGLTLGLVPSLLLALDEPVSLRGALVAAGAVVVLAHGVRHRLAAPFAFGAVTVALLALRHLQPISDAVPRWVALALVGLALLAVGISWEQRLHDVRSARRYLLALR